MLAFARSCGERGFTQQELADALPSKNWSSYRSRVVELWRKGLVVDTGKTKHHLGHAKEHIIWRAVEGPPKPPPPPTRKPVQRDLFD